MSDANDDIGSVGRLAIRGSRLEPLRNRMEAFVADHDDPVDLYEVREQTSADVSLSELVDEGRDGRLE
ncbi:hypothetical protein [Natranaeroarchaeum aerophilus]|uniref:Uncharacterized protein n=1 Tax=Natranaeroarchaeum aerophilus TaxID=2917711 RepID=A0AAE3FN29_9EURY|nr:hypothetical protein [Natranaeroarchaeum aerophilus]MCL9812046.1 hypothetical protein [Natranaeroarchaeum aerophilus]